MVYLLPRRDENCPDVVAFCDVVSAVKKQRIVSERTKRGRWWIVSTNWNGERIDYISISQQMKCQQMMNYLWTNERWREREREREDGLSLNRWNVKEKKKINHLPRAGSRRFEWIISRSTDEIREGRRRNARSRKIFFWTRQSICSKNRSNSVGIEQVALPLRYNVFSQTS